MGPPATYGAPKHKIPGLPESLPKRKTLVERGGEPTPRSHMPPPTRTNITRGSATYGHARSASAVPATAYTNGTRHDPRQRVPNAAEEDDTEDDAGITGKRK
ncbi:hypothetical protein LTR53_019161, partial [Teratosphaeriaceae sp. CCFEE 6253]